MTPAEEDTEILTNARAACASGEITREQEIDVNVIVMFAQIERMELE